MLLWGYLTIWEVDEPDPGTGATVELNDVQYKTEFRGSYWGYQKLRKESGKSHKKYFSIDNF